MLKGSVMSRARSVHPSVSMARGNLPAACRSRCSPIIIAARNTGVLAPLRRTKRPSTIRRSMVFPFCGKGIRIANAMMRPTCSPLMARKWTVPVSTKRRLNSWSSNRFSPVIRAQKSPCSLSEYSLLMRLTTGQRIRNPREGREGGFWPKVSEPGKDWMMAVGVFFRVGVDRGS